MKPDIAQSGGNTKMAWGSDVVAELLRRLGIRYVCVNPGSSFRGLHDSLVNYLGNDNPKMLLALHEQSVVAIAHGYFKASGEPMAVVLHSNVGLMAGMMSIFNAWCDRVPMLILGATGAVDTALRRSWIDWNHTFRDQAALVRHYVKWDEQPASPRAAIDSVLRTYQKACTMPCGPGYVILDRRLQEDEVEGAVSLPDLRRYQPLAAPAPSPEMIGEAAAMLAAARRPVILMGRVSRLQQDWDERVRLAELLDARVVTDLRMGASFPTEHPLHGGPADLFLSPSDNKLLAEADVILSLDWYDLADTLSQAHSAAKVIHVSVDTQTHNAFSGDHQRLAPVDLAIPLAPDVAVKPLIEALKGSKPAGSSARGRVAPMPPEGAFPATISTLADIGRALSSLREGRTICLARVPLNWPAGSYAFRAPLDYLGYDGGGGVGSGPGMTVGAALALEGSGYVTVGIMGDGEFIGASTALWTAAHYRIPMLIIVANNRSYFTDEIQQETVARQRQRSVQNRWIGQRMDDPPIDMAGIARNLGIDAEGPIEKASDLLDALRRGFEAVEAGKPFLVDVLVDPSRGASFDWLAGHA
jgi:thiamine pyrophosphate-dependent acetolactate synthase large subunit-like protein